MFSIAQQSASDLLLERLAEGRGAVALQGLSGSGKSHVAEKTLGGGLDTLVLDCGMISYRTEQIRSAVQRDARIVVLLHPGHTTKSAGSAITMHPDAVQLRNLSCAELGNWLDEATPTLSTSERDLVCRYSLGVPLLIERFLARRPVTRAAVVPQCAAYVQGIVDQCTLASKDRDAELRIILGKYSDFSIPDDIFPLISDAQNVRIGHSPISLLQSKLKPEAELPVPATLEPYDRYAQWLKVVRNEPFFEVFIEAMPDAEQFLETLGYCEFPDPAIDQALKRFVDADARKGATFYAPQNDGVLSQQMNKNGDSLDGWFRGHMLELARSSGNEAQLERTEVWGREVVSVRAPSLSSPFYLHQHDHEHAAVMPVAYTVECALQRKNVSYAVRYNDVIFRYDPSTKTYTPVPYEVVDYWKELYGKQWAEEGASEQGD